MKRDKKLGGFLKNYLRDFSWVAAGMGLAMVADFFFYILAGRLMSPVQFGYFGVISSLYYILLRSPFRAIEIVTKKIEAEGKDSMSVMGGRSLATGLLVFIVFLLLSGYIASYLQVPRAALIAFSFVFPLGYFTAAAVGKVQGDQDFETYGLYEFISSLIAFSAIIPVYIGYGAKAAALMFVIEIAAGLMFLGYRKNLSTGWKRFSRHRLLGESLIFVLVVHTAFSFDMIAVKRFFAPEIAGLYNTVSVLGKGLFFTAVAVNRSVFPKFVVDEDDRMKNLKLSQLLVLGAGSFATVFFLFFGELFITYTFGQGYDGAASFAPHYMVMITGVSSVALLTNYCLSTDLSFTRTALTLPIFQLTLLSLYHGSVLQIIYATFASSVLTALLLASRIYRSRS